MTYYLWHWANLQALDACLGLYRITGKVFLPEEVLLLLLSVAVVLGTLQLALVTWLEHRADGCTR